MPRRMIDSKLLFTELREHRYGSHQVLEMVFQHGDQHYFWRPRWSDVRHLFIKNVLTEYNNDSRQKANRLRLFRILTKTIQELLEEKENKNG